MRLLVVGSGIAGLSAALHAQAAGHEVTVVTKGAAGGGCTALAQGGIAGWYGPGDSPALHAADTMAAGAGHSDATAVDALVDGARSAIGSLVRYGVAFDRSADGLLLRGTEAAHGHSRILHAGGDATGHEISRALLAAAHEGGIGFVTQAVLTDLLVDGGAVRGIRMLRHGVEADLEADAVLLATGGAGQLYSRTTNPASATGDGIAATLRAGAAVADLEFVQFHPTVLPGADAFLVSEAVRGEGAALIDDDGRRFCVDVHPDGELAPRDVVARAIAAQEARQGSPVRLDATALGTRRLAERFPTIDRVTRERGADWSREPIAVSPAAHYLMGGVVTDLHGRTSLPGLLAIGEVARTGVHGANRLASNSLLEGAVFAARAVRSLSAASAPPAAPVPRLPSHFLPELGAHSGRNCDGSGEKTGFSRAVLQQLMWERVGLLRDDTALRAALGTIRAWAREATTPASAAEHEDRNLLQLAHATASAALARTESIGAHHRIDDVAIPALIGA